MFHRYAENLEGMHPDCGAFHPLLALQYQVYGSSEQIDEGVAIRGREEYSA